MDWGNIVFDRLWCACDTFKGKRISLLESDNLFFALYAVGADHQQVRLEDSDAFRNEFHNGSRSVGPNCGIHCILKNVAQFACDFTEEWKSVGAGTAFKGVRGDVKPLNVFGNRIRILENAGVLPQELQVLRRFLKEDLDELCSRRAHKLSCNTVREDLRSMRECP